MPSITGTTVHKIAFGAATFSVTNYGPGVACVIPIDNGGGFITPPDNSIPFEEVPSGQTIVMHSAGTFAGGAHYGYCVMNGSHAAANGYIVTDGARTGHQEFAYEVKA